MICCIREYRRLTSAGSVDEASSAVICVQVRQQNISDIFGPVTTSGKPADKPGSAVEISMAKEFCILFIAPSRINKYDAAISLNYK